MRRVTALLLAGVLTLGLAVGLLFAPAAGALSGSQFRAGNIISDADFYDAGTLTAADVQRLFALRYGGCATGYVCLRDYSTPTTSRAAEAGLCTAYTGRTSETAAAIIVNVARACGVNPEVLIVLLQKESGLVTTSRPDYSAPMGFGCPDTTGCDAKYFGYFNQVYLAARQFRLFRLRPTDYTYVAGRSSYVLYNPNTSCGGSQVYIANQATAGLYNYTPYQPNAAALSSLYGTGNSCSTYGNRNFWVYYNTWFAPPAAPYDAGGLVATTPDGTLTYYRNTTNPAAPYTDSEPIGSGWQNYDRVTSGDVDGDGRADLVATRPDGTLWLFRNTGSALPYGVGTEIGSGWGGYDRIATADVDGDGRADLVATRPDGTLWLLRSDGSAHPYSTATQIGASGWQRILRIVPADVTGDGRADLVAVHSDGSLWLCVNNGNPTHPYSGSVEIGASGWAALPGITATDVDVDGRADLLATHSDGSLWLYRNSGNAARPLLAGVEIGLSGWTYFTHLLPTTVMVPRHPVTANLYTVHGDGSLWDYPNRGPLDPYPTATRIGASGWSAYDRVMPAGVTGDGRADLLTTTPTGVLYLYRNSGVAGDPYRSPLRIGTGWTAYDRILPTSSDGAARADLFATRPDGTLWHFANAGSDTNPYPTGTQVSPAGWSVFDRLVLSDVTGDGRPDLVATKEDGSLWLATGTDVASRPFAAPVMVAASGWSGFDRIVASVGPAAPTTRTAGDLLARRTDGTLWYFPNTGVATRPFGTGQPLGRAGWSVYATLASGDVTGHRLSDLVATRPDGSLWLLPSAGTAPFGTGSRIGASGWAAFPRIAAGDVTGDGRADLVVTTSSGALLLCVDGGTAGHPFSTAVTIGASGWLGFDRIVAADVTGDGRADLIARKPDGTLWLYPNSGNVSRPFGAAVRIGASGWQSFDRIAAGDFTGDGLADLLVRRADGSLLLFRNLHRPGLPFGSPTVLAGAWASYDQVVGADVGRTGRADLVLTRPDGSLWLARNTGAPAAPVQGAAEVTPPGWANATLIAA